MKRFRLPKPTIRAKVLYAKDERKLTLIGIGVLLALFLFGFVLGRRVAA